MIHTVVDSPLGPLTLVADDEGRLTGVYMEGQRHRPAEDRFGTAVTVRADPAPTAPGPTAPAPAPAPAPGTLLPPASTPAEVVLARTAHQLAEYFAGDRREVDVPRAPAGTDFQRRVWDVLSRIPYGQTRTYAQVALEVGNPAAVRAVGAAVGRNPLSVVVPCHRVLGAGGALTGYAGGLDRKQLLLHLEHPLDPA